MEAACRCRDVVGDSNKIELVGPIWLAVWYGTWQKEFTI